jgi:hypothetical protein
MGYELHITRRDDWADTETPDIPIDEWLAYVHSDNELELTNGYEIKIGTETEFQNRPGYCEWNSHPTEKEPNARPWFSYWKGSIDTKNPDAPTIRKMIQIASSLNAKVQGDDGEIYTEEYLTELENQEKLKAAYRQQEKKAWWKFW